MDNLLNTGSWYERPAMQSVTTPVTSRVDVGGTALLPTFATAGATGVSGLGFGALAVAGQDAAPSAAGTATIHNSKRRGLPPRGRLR